MILIIIDCIYIACLLQDIISMLLYLLSWFACFLVLYRFYVYHLYLLLIACLHDFSTRHTSPYTCIYMCTSLGFILHTRWVASWQSLDLHVQIPERGT